MTRNIGGRRRTANSRHFRNRNQNVRIRNQISPVMQKVKSLLPARKSAWQLHILTGVALSTCQKLLSGHAQPNAEILRVLIASDLGWAVIEVIVQQALDREEGPAQPPRWYAEACEERDLTQIEREISKGRQTLARRRAARIAGEAQ